MRKSAVLTQTAPHRRVLLVLRSQTRLPRESGYARLGYCSSFVVQIVRLYRQANPALAPLQVGMVALRQLADNILCMRAIAYAVMP